MTIIAPDKGRASYARISDRASKLGVDLSKVQASHLKVHVLANANTSVYDFSIKKDAGTQAIHERKLDVNDAFVMTQLGFFLLKEDPAKPGTGQYYTYPNSTALAVAAEVDITHCETFYAGYFRLKVGDRVYSEAIETRKNRIARTTQKSSATTFDERWADDGFQDLNPDFTLGGTDKNEIQLVVPTFAAMQVQETTATTRLYLVFYARGYQIIGGSRLGQV